MGLVYQFLSSGSSLASLVLRSKSFSANDVMSQALLNMIFNEDLRGPRNGPEVSKLCGVILDKTILDQWRNQVKAGGAERPPGQHFWGNFYEAYIGDFYWAKYF